MADYVWYIAVALLAGLGSQVLSPQVHRIIIGVCAAGIALVGVMFLLRAARRGTYTAASSAAPSAPV